jgi:hypothetical protein
MRGSLVTNATLLFAALLVTAPHDSVFGQDAESVASALQRLSLGGGNVEQSPAGIDHAMEIVTEGTLCYIS